MSDLRQKARQQGIAAADEFIRRGDYWKPPAGRGVSFTQLLKQDPAMPTDEELAAAAAGWEEGWNERWAAEHQSRAN